VKFGKFPKLVAIVSSSALLLAGCAPAAPEPIIPDASGAPAGFSEYYEQVVEFEECGTRLYCAEIEVPMDWSDPNSEAISIATVFRQADSNAQGFILFNPGGPGASGYDWVKDSADFLGTEDLRSDWNILGFDPRGVGRSSAVACLSDSEYDEFLYGVSGFAIGSEEDIDVARAATADFATKCLERTGDLLEFVDTVSAARDMDVLRAVVGESKLNFLGYSYGSFLGTTYATLFPERVGRFVLDGAIDPTVSDDEQTLFQIEAFEAALIAFLENCQTFEACPFSGDVATDLTRIQQLLRSIEARPLATASGRELTIWAAVTGLIMTLYSDRYWPTLATAFNQALNGAGDQFLFLADFYNDRGEDGSYQTNLIAANYAISCLDNSASQSMFTIEAQNTRLLAAAPVLGRYWQFGGLRCASWPFPEAEKPANYSAAGAPTILVIGTTGDPATPYSQAQVLATEILEDGFLLTYNGEGHTIYGQNVRCIDQVVDEFFLTGELPATDPNCS
jgi:pimeloyl-ACP methyl ester carboxylesterase